MLDNDAIGRGGRCHFSRRPQKLAVGEFLADYFLNYPWIIQKRFGSSSRGIKMAKMWKRDREKEKKKKNGECTGLIGQDIARSHATGGPCLQPCRFSGTVRNSLSELPPLPGRRVFTHVTDTYRRLRSYVSPSTFCFTTRIKLDDGLAGIYSVFYECLHLALSIDRLHLSATQRLQSDAGPVPLTRPR